GAVQDEVRRHAVIAVRTRMTPPPVPHGYHSVTPYLVLDGAAKALDWYKDALSAKEVMRLGGPDGKIGHAEIEIGDSRIMLADENPAFDAHAPGRFGGSPRQHRPLRRRG